MSDSGVKRIWDSRFGSFSGQFWKFEMRLELEAESETGTENGLFSKPFISLSMLARPSKRRRREIGNANQNVMEV